MDLIYRVIADCYDGAPTYTYRFYHIHICYVIQITYMYMLTYIANLYVYVMYLSFIDKPNRQVLLLDTFLHAHSVQV